MELVRLPWLDPKRGGDKRYRYAYMCKACAADAMARFAHDQTEIDFLAWALKNGYVTFTQWWISYSPT